MKRRIFFTAILLLLTRVPYALPNIVFPAISHQFAISLVVRSYYSILLALLILIVESLCIRKILFTSLRKAFLLSFVINFISSACGFFIVTFAEFPMRKVGITIFGYQNMRLGTYLGLIPGYILTVFIEFIVLFAIFTINISGSCENKSSEYIKNVTHPKNIFKAAVIMNAISYMLILLAITTADILTHGACFKTY